MGLTSQCGESEGNHNYIEFVLSGCKCKKGCVNNQCGCRKNKHVCGPGYKCTSCLNTVTYQQVEEDIHNLEITEECSSDEEMVETDTDELVECDEETDEIMAFVFGQDSGSEDEA